MFCYYCKADDGYDYETGMPCCIEEIEYDEPWGSAEPPVPGELEGLVPNYLVSLFDDPWAVTA